MSELTGMSAATEPAVARDPFVVFDGLLTALMERLMRLMFEGVSGGFRVWV